jgi:hypothetical protein
VGLFFCAPREWPGDANTQADFADFAVFATRMKHAAMACFPHVNVPMVTTLREKLPQEDRDLHLSGSHTNW